MEDRPEKLDYKSRLFIVIYIVNKYDQTIVNVIIFLTHNFNSITYEMSAVAMIKTGF